MDSYNGIKYYKSIHSKAIQSGQSFMRCWRIYNNVLVPTAFDYRNIKNFKVNWSDKINDSFGSEIFFLTSMEENVEVCYVDPREISQFCVVGLIKETTFHEVKGEEFGLL